MTETRQEYIIVEIMGKYIESDVNYNVGDQFDLRGRPQIVVAKFRSHSDIDILFICDTKLLKQHHVTNLLDIWRNSDIESHNTTVPKKVVLLPIWSWFGYYTFKSTICVSDYFSYVDSDNEKLIGYALDIIELKTNNLKMIAAGDGHKKGKHYLKEWQDRKIALGLAIDTF